jgi:hypothetical protein
MNYFKHAIVFSVLSVLILVIAFVLPENMVFVKDAGGRINAGIMFPLLPVCWGTSVVAFAMNFLYVETLYIENYFKVKQSRKLLPSMIATPSIISFLWFCYHLA